MHDKSPDRLNHMTGRPNHPIFVYYNGTFVHLRNGAHMRMSSLISNLMNTGHDITLFSFANHPTEPWDEEAQTLFRKNYPGVRLVLDIQTGALRKLTSLKNALTSLFPTLSRRILAIRKRGESPNYERLLAENPEAVWIVNYADGLTQLNGLPSGPVIVETHDLKFVNVAKKDNVSPVSIRPLLRLRSELGVLGCVLGLVAISPVEAWFFRTMSPGSQTFYIPQYGSPKAPTQMPRPDTGYRYDLVFVGSEMFQNARGLLRFFQDNIGWLPQLRIAVAGKVGNDPDVRAFAQDRPNIELLGFVADIAELYACSKAAISPVDGTGLKIKVIDALAHGLPVFGSLETLEGLAPGFERCAFPIKRAIMAPLLNDFDKLEEARAQALAYWETLSSVGDLTAFGDFLSIVTTRDAAVTPA